MKKIMLLMFLLMAYPAWGIIEELESDTAYRDLTSIVTVLTDTPDASNPMICQGLIYLGNDANGLDGSGGLFELTITVGAQTVMPSPQEVQFSTAVRASVWTSQFPVPANAEVILRVKSPNAGDDDVYVDAHLYDVFPVNVASGVIESDVQLVEGSDATTYFVSRSLAAADYFLYGTDDVTLANGPHGGSGATFNLKTFTVSNPDGTAVTFSAPSSGKGFYVYAENSDAVKFENAHNGFGFAITGDEGDLVSAVTDWILSVVDDILEDTSAYDTDLERAAAIWNAATIAYGGAGTYGQAAEDVFEDTATTIPGLITAGGIGDGSVVVDHDYGGADALAYGTAGGAGIDNGVIRAYLKSDYDAGNTGSAFIKASTRTDVNGRWTNQMNLDPATYTLYYFKQGAYSPSTQEVTVE